MQYEVRLQPLAETDLEEAYLWAAAHAPATAAEWLRRFEEAIQSLCRHPQRCGVAPEGELVGRDLRQLNYGRKPNVFRVVFWISEPVVHVLRIRRASRQDFTKSDFVD